MHYRDQFSSRCRAVSFAISGCFYSHAKIKTAISRYYCDYVDQQLQHSAEIVFEACQYLNIDRSTVAWFHPDFQEEIARLYPNNSPKIQEQTISQVEELSQADRVEPIDCFNHAISIYNRESI